MNSLLVFHIGLNMLGHSSNVSAWDTCNIAKYYVTLGYPLTGKVLLLVCLHTPSPSFGRRTFVFALSETFRQCTMHLHRPHTDIEIEINWNEREKFHFYAIVKHMWTFHLLKAWSERWQKQFKSFCSSTQSYTIQQQLKCNVILYIYWNAAINL